MTENEERMVKLYAELTGEEECRGRGVWMYVAKEGSERCQAEFGWPMAILSERARVRSEAQSRDCAEASTARQILICNLVGALALGVARYWSGRRSVIRVLKG